MLHNLKPSPGRKKRKKRVGRGGQHGTYACRGQKGQRSRSGGKRGLKLKGFRQILRRVPKLRGFKSLKAKNQIVNLGQLNDKYKAGEIVNAKTLLAKGLIKSIQQPIKILGKGKLNKKLIIQVDLLSELAKKAIKIKLKTNPPAGGEKVSAKGGPASGGKTTIKK